MDSVAYYVRNTIWNKISNAIASNTTSDRNIWHSSRNILIYSNFDIIIPTIDLIKEDLNDAIK